MNQFSQQAIHDVVELEEMLSEPSDGVVAAMRRMEGDLLILGVGGKMGPTLARMARRASDAAGVDRQVIGVSRFSDTSLPSQLESDGIQTVRCDLLDADAIRQLPDSPNVLYMAGLKFGTQHNPSLTWAINTAVPTLVAQRFAGANMVVMSTGNVYGVSHVPSGGARETDPLRPTGEYAMSAVGRERIFEHFAQQHNTPTAIIRLYYAVEMRYGVPVDIAERIQQGEPIDLSMGYASLIWQGDASSHVLQAFDRVAVPARPINVAGPDIVSIRAMALRLGELMGKEPVFTRTESDKALACDTTLARDWFGWRVPLDQLLVWIADWVTQGKPRHGKATHFENRAGDF